MNTKLLYCYTFLPMCTAAKTRFFYANISASNFRSIFDVLRALISYNVDQTFLCTATSISRSTLEAAICIKNMSKGPDGRALSRSSFSLDYGGPSVRSRTFTGSNYPGHPHLPLDLLITTVCRTFSDPASYISCWLFVLKLYQFNCISQTKLGWSNVTKIIHTIHHS